MDQHIIDAIPVPAAMIAGDDTFALANPAFQQLFAQMALGRSYLTVLRQPKLVSLIEAARTGNAPNASEITINGTPGGEFRATAAVVENDAVLICLQDLNETANAIQMRRNFVSDLGHELKTPLTAIKGILETCDGDPDAFTSFLPLLSGEVDRMGNLIRDLQLLSNVQHNERRIPNENVVLQKVVQEACARLALLAESAGITLKTTLPDTPISLLGDRDELVRAISNLVENSIRYGNKGGNVTLSAVSNSGSHVLEVTDDGPGVDLHHIPRLTERFYRVDSHRSRDSGGSGLGLAIVKHIVNRHRGRMTIDKNEGNGLRVRLTFPHHQSA